METIGEGAVLGRVVGYGEQQTLEPLSAPLLPDRRFDDILAAIDLTEAGVRLSDTNKAYIGIEKTRALVLAMRGKAKREA